MKSQWLINKILNNLFKVEKPIPAIGFSLCSAICPAKVGINPNRLRGFQRLFSVYSRNNPYFISFPAIDFFVFKEYNYGSTLKDSWLQLFADILR